MNDTTTNTTGNVSTAALTEYDIIIAIDTSGSMGDTVKAGASITRWSAVQESAITIIREAQQIDSDGLGLVLFGGNVESFDGVTVDKAREVFASKSPRGGTPLAEGLTAALGLAGKSAKKDLIIVFTDGVPNDPQAAAKVIVDASQSLEKDEDLTFLFIQVGDDVHATAYLKSLDDDLKGAKFDIVDVKTVAEADAFPSTVELLLAAIAG